MTTLRFFAAARAAVGVDEVEVDSGGAGSGAGAGAGAGAAVLGGAVLGGAVLGDALRAVDAADPARWSRLQERCSYLVDGVTTRDRTTSLAGVAVVDVMPPFAGG